MRIKRRASAIVAIVIIVTILAPITAGAVSIGDKEINSKAACVIDFETGEVLYGYAESEQRIPASMTKILAAYIIYDADRTGEMKLSSTTKINKSISSASYNTTYSNVPLPEGLSVTIQELLEVVMIRSACAATDALAVALCGSVDAFVVRMNKKINDLGINAQFYDTYGASPDNRISAKGIAVLTRALIRDYPEVLKITAKKTVTFRGVTYNSSNLLLGEYEGLDGFKTGYTDPAGYCFIGTAKRNDHRVISVTMGATLSSRYPDTRTMLDYGFSKFETPEINTDPGTPDNPNRPENSNGAGNSAGTNDPSTGSGNANNPGAAAENKNPTSGTNPAGTVMPSSHLLTLNGAAVSTFAYNIGGNNYFKLRDVAAMLSGTTNQFEVTWFEETQTVSIQSGLAYTIVGGELEPLANEARRFTHTSSKIICNGAQCEFDVYTVGGNNYFKLRDLASIIGFGVGWDAVSKTIIIATQLAVA